MSNERDTTRIVRSWLEEGADRIPDRVLDVVEARLHATPQRRAGWLARRFSIMNRTTVRYGLGAAAIIFVLVLGSRFLPTSNTGGPQPTPTPTPEPTPAPLTGTDRNLAAGTYRAGDPFLFPLEATVPAGFRGHIGGPYYVDLYPDSRAGGLFFIVFDEVSVDPCDASKGMTTVPATGERGAKTAADLVTALSEMPGIEVSDVSDVTVSGYTGTSLTITAPDSFAGCNLGPDGYVLWRLPLRANFAMTEGQVYRLWVLDVVGPRLQQDQRLVIMLDETGSNETQRAELRAVFDSIRILPAS
ncbi:MAG TPA: hypothetical protein VF013_00405 [Candidatus Limnocylindria bacterium]